MNGRSVGRRPSRPWGWGDKGSPAALKGSTVASKWAHGYACRRVLGVGLQGTRSATPSPCTTTVTGPTPQAWTDRIPRRHLAPLGVTLDGPALWIQNEKRGKFRSEQCATKATGRVTKTGSQMTLLTVAVPPKLPTKTVWCRSNRVAPQAFRRRTRR